VSAPPPICPTCQSRDPTLLGKLPDSDCFAGKRLLHPLPGGSLYRCTRCRLKFRHPLQAAETYHALYDNAETTAWPATSSRPDWELVIAQIDALKPRGGRILDFGCYTGGLLSRLDARHERSGVEVNRSACRIASETTGAEVWSSIEEIPAERFDVIVIADVIEHVPDPRSLLELLATRLAADGVVIVTTGDADTPLWNRFGANYWYCFYPEHIAFLSRAWVELALCRQGWEILHCERFRYRRLGPLRRLLELAFACAYGLWPRFYLYTASRLRRWSGRRPISSVAGNGASADHLLIVARPNRSS
jgi:SAM-dependent methyltransferase